MDSTVSRLLQRCWAASLLAALLLAPGAWARGEWYDHYERAIRSIEQGDGQQALVWLDRALAAKPRSGYLRTYGNNYIQYAPQFYRGLAWELLDDCTAALRAFEASDADRETAQEAGLAETLRESRERCSRALAPPAEPQPGMVKPPPTAPKLLADPMELRAAFGAYLEGDFDGAVQRFGKLAAESPESARIQLMLGIALHGWWASTGRNDEALLTRARAALARAAVADPDLVPDPALCPPPVVALYRSLR